MRSTATHAEGEQQLSLLCAAEQAIFNTRRHCSVCIYFICSVHALFFFRCIFQTVNFWKTYFFFYSVQLCRTSNSGAGVLFIIFAPLKYRVISLSVIVFLVLCMWLEFDFTRKRLRQQVCDYYYNIYDETCKWDRGVLYYYNNYYYYYYQSRTISPFVQAKWLSVVSSRRELLRRPHCDCGVCVSAAFLFFFLSPLGSLLNLLCQWLLDYERRSCSRNTTTLNARTYLHRHYNREKGTRRRPDTRQSRFHQWVYIIRITPGLVYTYSRIRDYFFSLSPSMWYIDFKSDSSSTLFSRV